MPIISNWPDGRTYPIALNPTFDELCVFVELNKGSFNTLRICYNDDSRFVEDHFIAFGSGYGNTHESICSAIKNHYKRKRYPSCKSIILFHDVHQLFFNMESGENVHFSKGIIDLPYALRTALKDVTRLFAEYDEDGK